MELNEKKADNSWISNLILNVIVIRELVEHAPQGLNEIKSIPEVIHISLTKDGWLSDSNGDGRHLNWHHT